MVNNDSLDVLLTNVQYVPNLTTNLLSVGQLISNGNTVDFDVEGCKIYNKIGILVAVGKLFINWSFKPRVAISGTGD